MTRDTESQYGKLFEDSPVSLWEEDFSELKKHIDELRTSGVTDFHQYFKEYPNELMKCADMVEIVRVNKATLKLQGVERDEDLLGPLSRFLVDEAFDLFLGEIVALAKGETKFEQSVVIPTIHGEDRHILLVLSVPDEFRETWSRVIVSMLDITEKVEVKKTLADERRAFQIIAEAALEPFYTSETSHRILQGMIDLLGFDIGTIRLYNKEKRVLTLHTSIDVSEETRIDVSIDDSDYLAAQVARTKTPVFLSDVKTESFLEQPRHVIDDLGIVSLIFWPILGPNEDILGVINVASRIKKNLSEHDRVLFQMIADMLSTVIIRHKAQEDLRLSEERYRSLANSIIDIIWIIDIDFGITFISPSCYQIVGYTPEELIGMPVTTVLAEESRKFLTEEMAFALEMEEKVGKDGYTAQPLEVQLLHKNGSRVWAEINRVFLRDEYDRPIATLGVARDITERITTAQKLETALQTAAFYNDLMAHDISNMQQGIITSMELLLHSDNLPKEMRHLVRAALSQSIRGVALVNHVKKLAQVEESTLNLAPTDPYLSLSDAITMVRNTFPEKEIGIKTNITAEEFSVLADGFLVDVFYNLLHNSVRLDPKPNVLIEIEAEITRGDYLSIRFSDYGPGIDDSHKKTLFSRTKVDGRRVAGIGLTLVKRIAERYEGSISIEDRIKGDCSKGACFVLEIPIAN
ncbi:MAG: PAS domain S-box protein [Candidatus Thorarchaeota archaeon]|nr:PAS domain S-box protein [Candidatus Thorarchaeota archaeon]